MRSSCLVALRPVSSRRTERLRKWARRHPRLTSAAAVAAVAALLLTAAGAVLAQARENLTTTREQLQAAQAQERRRSYEAGTVRALCLVNTVSDLQDHLRRCG